MREALYRLFAPPSFLAMPAVGVDIGDDAVRTLAFAGTPGRVRLSWWAEESLSAGAVAGGVLRNKDAVVDALKKVRAAHPFTFAALAIPEEQAYLFEIDAPALSRAEAHAAIELRLEEEVPLHVADAVFDCAPLAATEGAAAGTRRYSVAAVPRKVSEMYQEVCADAGIAPLSFDILPAAIVRAVVALHNHRTLLIANLTAGGAGFYIAASARARFASTLSLPVQKLTDAASAREKDALLPHDALAALGAEARRVCEFWEARASAGASPVEAVVVCGAGAADERILSALTAETRLPVEAASVWQNAFSVESRVPPLAREDAIRFAGAVGLALRSFWYV